MRARMMTYEIHGLQDAKHKSCDKVHWCRHVLSVSMGYFVLYRLVQGRVKIQVYSDMFLFHLGF